MKQDFHIFLDFDGVLHSFSDFAKGNTFCRMPLFESLLKKIKDKNPELNIHVVISSAWRTNFSNEDINTQFGKCKKYIKSFDKLSDESFYSKIKWSVEQEDYILEENKYLTVLDYIKTNNVKNFLVIDDCDGLFYNTVYKEPPPLYLKYPIISENNIKIDPDFYDEEGKYKDLFLNYSGYLWEYMSKEERNFNRRYYSTYKKNEFDGYLSEEDVSNIGAYLNFEVIG